MIREKDALDYHTQDRPGKLAVAATKPCLAPREMRLAYLPGAVFPARVIARNPEAAYRLTARGNLVGVVTNGTAVTGLGEAGPAAAKPLQEGIAVLFKRLADIDVFDLELAAPEPESFVEAVLALEPTFGGLNLRDLRAPEGLEIYEALQKRLSIPVLHENLHSTAVVATAALINALELTDRRLEGLRVVICGAGTVGIGCARMLRSLGVPAEGLWLYDLHGLLHPGRADLSPYQRDYAREDGPRELAEGLRGADVFLGASTGNVLTGEMIRAMNRYPIVVAMATPEPEISFAAASAARRDVLVATSVDRDPNAIVDLLSFPYIFRGALDVHASRITEGMTLAAARALAELAREDVIEEVCRAYGQETFTFGPGYLVPRPIDPRILVWESAAVARQAMLEGVARQPVEPEEYQESLAVRLGTGREFMRHVILKARQVAPRIVFPEGTSETVLRACAIISDEGIGSPVLLGREEEILLTAERLGLDLGGAAVIDPQHGASHDAYVEEYFRLRARRGVTREMARRRLTQPGYYGALMLRRGDADMMIAGVTAHYPESLRTVLEVIGPAPGVHRIASLHMVLRPREVIFLSDCAVNIEPDADELAEIALLAARSVRSLGLEPRVAMLAFASFGSVDHPLTRKVREATRRARERAPDLIVDGEIQLLAALDGELRRQLYPFTHLQQEPNLLIFPDLQSGNLALHTLQQLGQLAPVGPILTGTARPVHLVQVGCSVQDLVNLAAVGAVVAPAGPSTDPG